jgi:excisionase family DNA binding protein
MGQSEHRLRETGEGRFSPLLRPNDIARMLGVSRAWVYDAARSGRIPSVRLGGQDGPLRFVAEDIEGWLAETRARWLPGRQDYGRGGAPDERREHAPDHAGGADAQVRGQQSLL